MPFDEDRTPRWVAPLSALTLVLLVAWIVLAVTAGPAPDGHIACPTCPGTRAAENTDQR